MDANPGPSACAVDVLPLHHVPLENLECHRGPRQARQVVLTLWSQEVGNRERNALMMPSHSQIEPKRHMGQPGPLTPEARIIPLDQQPSDCSEANRQTLSMPSSQVPARVASTPSNV